MTTETRKRRSYTEDFKRDAVALVTEQGYKVTEAARSLVAVPDTILIKQGDDIGRPSRLIVEIPASGGIVVRGTAVSIDSEQGGACSADQTD